MAEVKKKKKTGVRRERKERRFAPEVTQGSKVVALFGMVGALVLGAGVYGQWIRDVPLPQGFYLLAGGALVLGLALWFSDVGARPVRVGDAGIAVEKGSELARVAWCDIDRIYVESSNLVIEAAPAHLTLSLSLQGHPVAAAWILSEATQRLPDVVDVHSSVLQGLPKPKETDGESIPISSIQVAGRHCARCDKVISFEREARLCPNCAEVYHDNHVPKSCVTCDADIAGRAVRA